MFVDLCGNLLDYHCESKLDEHRIFCQGVGLMSHLDLNKFKIALCRLF